MHLIGKSQTAKSAMIVRALFICALSLSFCQTAVAQRNASARIAWYGIYTTSASKEIADAASPTGKRFVSTPVPPAANSDRIPVKELRFGMGYVLSGRAGTVTVKHVYRFPLGGIVDKASGQTSTGYERTEEHKTGEIILMGWNMGGSDMVPGVWTFEVWQGDRKLLAKEFTLYTP